MHTHCSPTNHSLSQMIVPKFECILFGFHRISLFIAKIAFASIPSNIGDCRMHIFVRLVDNLQTPKTIISYFFGHRLLSIPLSGSFRNQALEKITKIKIKTKQKYSLLSSYKDLKNQL